MWGCEEVKKYEDVHGTFNELPKLDGNN